MWPASYALVSTSISTSLTLGLPRFSLTQSVETRTSGCAYAAMRPSFSRLGAGDQVGNVPHQVRGVLEDVVREDHDAEAGAVALDDPPGPLVDQAGAGAGEQALGLAQLHGAGVRQLVVDLQDLVDERRLEQLRDTELAQVAQSGDVVPLGRLHRDHLDVGLLAPQEPARPRHGAAGAQRDEQVGDPPFGLPPDLRAGGALVGEDVLLVLVLVGHDVALL